MHKVLTEEAAKKIKFTGDGMKKANDISDELSKPVYKTVNFVLNIARKVRDFLQSVGDDGAYTSTKRHSGGTLPRFHTGGSPNFGAPKMDEIDARLLRNEMVLTAGQQMNLFKMIKSYNASAASLKEKQKKDDTSSQPTTINIAALHVREEADVKKIAEQLEQLSQRRQRSRGEY
jgi:hypothetical protein